MPGFLVHVGAAIICPHGGQAQIISSNTRVLVGGMPVATMTDVTLVAGCAFHRAAGQTAALHQGAMADARDARTGERPARHPASQHRPLLQP